jgi:hypothetical protein
MTSINPEITILVTKLIEKETATHRRKKWPVETSQGKCDVEMTFKKLSQTFYLTY